MTKIAGVVKSIALICTIASISVFVNIRSSENSILDQREERSRTIPTKVGLSSYAPKDASFPEPLNTKETTGTKDDKICVIHVGPHKTGSTTLQGFLSRPVTKDALKRDNYEGPSFPGSVDTNHAKFVNCFRPDRNWFCPTEKKISDTKTNFASFVSNAAIGGSNIILTSEEFARSDLNITDLISYLAPEYKIHIVLYYRRFYDWIYSLYNQLSKNKKVTEPLTFVDWLSEKNFEMYGNGNEILSSVGVYNRYKNASEVFNITVVNMHEDPDNFNTLTRFTCDHMDNAPEVCEVAKSYRGGDINLSTDVKWKIFRVDVHHHHSIQLSDDDERWEQIEEKFHQMTVIPQVCLSTKWKNKLLQTSLEDEIALTPEWWYNSEEGLENLKSDFEVKINSTFCSMDVNAILTSSEWQDFLTDLEEDATEEES